MNKYLLLSSIITGILLLRIIYKKYNNNYLILYFFIILGIITSILNHGTSCKLLKYLDRLIIVLNILYINLFIYKNRDIIKNKMIVYISLIIAVICYISSKFNKNFYIKSYIHCCSHLLAVPLLYNIHY